MTLEDELLGSDQVEHNINAHSKRRKHTLSHCMVNPDVELEKKCVSDINIEGVIVQSADVMGNNHLIGNGHVIDQEGTVGSGTAVDQNKDVELSLPEGNVNNTPA